MFCKIIKTSVVTFLSSKRSSDNYNGPMFSIDCLNKAKTDVFGKKQNGQVEVELEIEILDISSLDAVEEEISTEINLIQSWIDTRCTFKVLLDPFFEPFLISSMIRVKMMRRIMSSSKEVTLSPYGPQTPTFQTP